MPLACMNAYTVVGPTKRKPSSFSTFDMRFDRSVEGGTSPSFR